MARLRWALMAAAVLGGLLMPEFYDWSGEDQSRPAPVVRWIALGIVLFDLCAFVWLALQKKQSVPIFGSAGKQFKTWHLLIAMTVVALVLVVQGWPGVVLAHGILAGAIIYALAWAIKERNLRWQLTALVVCFWAPMLWVFRWPEFRGSFPQVLLMLPGLPGILPGAWTNYLLGRNMVDNMNMPALITAGALLLGVWMTHLGPRRAFGVSLAILTMSLFSSFVLQALVRM